MRIYVVVCNLRSKDERRKVGKMNLSNKEFHILKHSLGLKKGKDIYRNHFVTGEGSADYPICETLVEKGLLFKRQALFDEIDDRYIYHVTDEGIKAAQE